jgi:ORF6N domain
MRILVSRCRTLARMLKRVVHCRDSAQGRLSVASRRQALAPVEPIARAILVLRGHRVLLDAELATLYGVTTKRLNEQVKRNAKRFPEDFVFQLTASEVIALRSQFGDG